MISATQSPVLFGKVVSPRWTAAPKAVSRPPALSAKPSLRTRFLTALLRALSSWGA
jgi:hypothetical protein